MEPHVASFGRLLHERRTRLGLTQRELAERAGVSVRAVRYIERGEVQQPRQESVRSLAEAVGVDPDQLSLPAARGQKDADSSSLCLGILGSLTVRLGRRTVDIGSLKQRCMLGLLALQPNEVVSRDEIIDVLWGDDPPVTCVSLVHSYASRLRQTLEGSRQTSSREQHITATRQGYKLTVEPEQLDLFVFNDLVIRAREMHDDNEESALDLFHQGLSSWRGPVLADTVPGLRQHPAAIRLSHQRLAVVLAHADLAIQTGRPEQAVEHLRALACSEPLHEGMHARLMLALAGSGQRAAALQVFSDIRTRLSHELGVDPSEELKAAHLQVLRQEAPSEPVPETESRQRSALVMRMVAPAQLPPDVAGFTGRCRALDRLRDLVSPTVTGTGAKVIAVTGMAGVGKSALGVHWAHEMRGMFPDGQLYLELNGNSHTPLCPVEALRRLLSALGVPPDRIPAAQAEATALFRTLLADRRMLIVLDDAASTAQIRPLLPGNPDCLVLITSRTQLVSLTASDGAPLVNLDVLAPEESAALLATMLGRKRVAAEPEAAAMLAELCGHLPLALRIAATNLIVRPGRRLESFVAELRDGDRLSALRVDGDDLSIRDAIDISYRKLRPAARQLFRYLGRHAEPEITYVTAAATLGTAVHRVKPLLEQLCMASMLRRVAHDRYRMHGLLRYYAAEREQMETFTAMSECLG
ncbi:BTAD domain-containing putative transcriptional regulator [Nonomuraea terrae]|nr:BTAD domain-containing putative transcriptional regulator [Nonomuraea terrae]